MRFALRPRKKDREVVIPPDHTGEHDHSHEESGISRRRFVIGTAIGLAGFAKSAWA